MSEVKKKYRLKSELKYVVYGLSFLILATFIYLTYSMIVRAININKLNEAKKASYEKTYEALNMKVNEDLLEVEYGDDFDIDSIVAESNGEVSIDGRVDTSKIGTYTLNFLVKTKDEYDQEVSKSFASDIEVVDTKKPIIELSDTNLSMLLGEEFEPLENIVKVYDEVDGDINYSEELSRNSFTVESDIDTNKEGVYDIKVTAKDKNGNKSEATYQMSVIGMNSEAEFPYYIKINRALNNVTIYAMDTNGEYSIPFKAMVCSTGTATPLGIYQTDINYRWRLLFGGVYGQYATRIVGDILFHSVPYFSQNLNDLEYEEYNKLGTAASMGCVRLAVIDAKWIYDNCPLGTTVEFYDDYEDVGPLGKPIPITIDVNSPNRGWDPTDPDPNNPWHN